VCCNNSKRKQNQSNLHLQLPTDTHTSFTAENWTWTPPITPSHRKHHDSMLKQRAANRKRRLSALPNIVPYIYGVKISGFARSSIYRVFTKEWCGFKNLVNDYILQLDGAPPPPPNFIEMYESYSIVFSNSAGSDVLQMETTTYTYYIGRIRLSCGCVSCDPGCMH
jgi:hypothetical protein